MAARTVRTRVATDADLTSVVGLWDALREGSERLGPFGPPTTSQELGSRLLTLAHDANHRVVIAEVEEDVVGVAVLSLLPITPISDVQSVQISYLHVRHDRRRRGVGGAIVEAALAFAMDSGADYVTVGVFPGSRDTNRYFARLGFRPLVVRRAISTPSLQRRLSGDSTTRDLLTLRRRRARGA